MVSIIQIILKREGDLFNHTSLDQSIIFRLRQLRNGATTLRM